MTNSHTKKISAYITSKGTGQKVEKVKISHLITTKASETPSIKIYKNKTPSDVYASAD